MHSQNAVKSLRIEADGQERQGQLVGVGFHPSAQLYKGAASQSHDLETDATGASPGDVGRPNFPSMSVSRQVAFGMIMQTRHRVAAPTARKTLKNSGIVSITTLQEPREIEHAKHWWRIGLPLHASGEI